MELFFFSLLTIMELLFGQWILSFIKSAFSLEKGIFSLSENIAISSLLGMFSFGWIHYMTSRYYQQSPMGWIITILLACLALYDLKKMGSFFYTPIQKMNKKKVLNYIIILCFGYVLYFIPFKENEQHISMGLSIQSDFSAHLAVIHSFFENGNLLTEYPHFAHDGIRYHFLFYYLTSLYISAGVPLVLALNLLSLKSLWLFYEIYKKFMSQFFSEYISNLGFFLLFIRISWTLPYELLWGTKSFLQLLQSQVFISSTPNEHWGIWGINVWANQRHLPFALALLFFILLLLTTKIFFHHKRTNLFFK
jgi:hypothetical protein